MLDHNPLPALRRLLCHHNDSVRKEAAWTISNITAGCACSMCVNMARPRRPAPHIQCVIDAEIVPLLVPLVASAQLDLRTEATYSIYNATVTPVL